MARLLFGAVLFVTIVAQATILPRFNPFAITPDLTVVLLFFWMTRRSLRESLTWALIVGLLVDVVALDTLGIHTLAYLPVVAMAWPMRVRPWQFNVIVAVLLVFMASVFQSTLLTLARGHMPGIDNGIQALVQTALVPVFYMFFRWVTRR